jgi:flagellar biosynthesis protein
MMGKDKKEKRHRLKAAALRYQPAKDDAPQLVAKGEGKLAEKIIQLAKEHGVPITEDPDLVEILSKMDIGREISPDLYRVVAELLVFVYRLKERWQKLHPSEQPAGN